jgi:hypothetical protein
MRFHPRLEVVEQEDWPWEDHIGQEHKLEVVLSPTMDLS